RTNMTEFAFSGLGINPHYDTPRNPHDRPAARIPGGSSSGAAVSVTDGMAFGALGTDTGGSCRLPAAFCGIVGFKPTAHRVPTAGAFPLSTSLDSIGPLAATVECCATLDAVLAGEPAVELVPFPLAGLRMAVPQTMVLEGVEPVVARAFESALAALRKAGARMADIPLRELAELPQINAKGGLAAAEAYAIHRSLIAKAEKMYDPRVLVRILRGQEQDAADYIELRAARADFIRRLAAIAAPYDALVMPTVPVTAPRLADLVSDDAYRHANFLVLRNPALANFLDRCSISIPCHHAGDAPVGLMLIGEHGADRRLLSIAAAIETVVSPCFAEARPRRWCRATRHQYPRVKPAGDACELTPVRVFGKQIRARKSATMTVSQAVRLHNGFFIEPGAAADPGRGPQALRSIRRRVLAGEGPQR